MNKKMRTGYVNTYTIHVDRTQNRSNRKQHNHYIYEKTHRSERPEPDMNEKRTGLVIEKNGTNP